MNPKQTEDIFSLLIGKCVQTVRRSRNVDISHHPPRADVEGHSDIASLFRSTADGETAHAFGHLGTCFSLLRRSETSHLLLLLLLLPPSFNCCK